MDTDDIYQKFPYFKKSKEFSKSLSGVTITQGQMIDSRMCLISILTALKKSNSLAMNYTQVTDFKWSQQNDKKITGIQVKDKLSNQLYQINAKNIINCTGVFSDHLRKQANPSLHNRILAAKGTHIVLDLPFCQQGMGMIVPKTKDGRLLFVLPFHGADNRLYTLLGTTDDYSQVKSNVQSNEQQITYLLGEFQQYVDTALVGNLRDKVVASWAGLRPLVLTEAAAKLGEMKSKSVSRCHVVQVDKHSGLVSLMGGKWTTYRQMGEDVIKEIYSQSKLQSDKKGIALVGSFKSKDEEVELEQLLRKCVNSQSEQIKEKIARDLINRYGMRSKNILKYTNPTDKLNVIQLQGSEFKMTKQQILYNINEQMAVNQDDIVDRRLGLSFFDQRLNKQWKQVVRDIIIQSSLQK